MKQIRNKANKRRENNKVKKYYVCDWRPSFEYNFANTMSTLRMKCKKEMLIVMLILS